jgi:hypothetical protein
MIDRSLEYSGWNLLDSSQVVAEITDRTPASANIFVPKGLTHETRNFAAAAHSRMAIHRAFI